MTCKLALVADERKQIEQILAELLERHPLHDIKHYDSQERAATTCTVDFGPTEFELVCEAVAKIGGLDPRRVKGRTREQMRPLKCAGYILRAKYRWSYERIGEKFGRTHASVIAWCKGLAAPVGGELDTVVRRVWEELIRF